MIQTIDVRQMIEQLLRSLRLKSNGLNKCPFKMCQIELFTSDNTIFEGVENFSNFPKEVDLEIYINNSDCSDGELLSLSICGEDNTKVADDKKLKAYIKSVVKTEKCEQDLTVIKTEPVE